MLRYRLIGSADQPVPSSDLARPTGAAHPHERSSSLTLYVEGRDGSRGARNLLIFGEGGEVDRVPGQILRKAMWDRLDMLDELASNADNGSLLSVARSELPRLTSGWRALLAAHAPDPQGRCPECSQYWRPRMAPCSVWRAAHEYLVSAEAVSQGCPARSPLPVGAGTVG